MWSPDRTVWGRWLGWGAIVFALLGVSCSRPLPDVVPLEAVRVLPIEAPFPVEPSGLCLRDGRLFTVCDKTDDTIFEVILEADHARLVPFLTFIPPPGAPHLDLEGITSGPNGSFFLVSESTARVLQVFPDGSSRWASGSLLGVGQGAGLFAVPNGYLEGITRLPDGSFLLAAERQSRGLIHLTDTGSAVPHDLNRTRFGKELRLLRFTDFTGLDQFEETVWVLFRNANLITTLVQIEDGWREGARGWSFRHIVENPLHAYEDMRFGHAEGLAVDEQHFFVILDNQRQARTADRSDRRPLLLILQRLDGMQ